MLWYNNEFTTKNRPNPVYQSKQKHDSLKYVLKNGLGVIDTGAHIGDYGLPLAKALIKYHANGKKNNPIKNMLKNKIYTHFIPKISSLDAKKKWIISSLNSSGIIFVDLGAVSYTHLTLPTTD